MVVVLVANNIIMFSITLTNPSVLPGQEKRLRNVQINVSNGEDS